VAARALPDRKERLLEHVLDVGRWQRGPQARGQPRRVPHEQLAQRGVVACRQGGDQLVVVHHHLYCTYERSGSRQDRAKSRKSLRPAATYYFRSKAQILEQALFLAAARVRPG